MWELFITKKDRKALVASIENWEKRAAGTYDGPKGAKGCPLCEIYNPYALGPCDGCPVAEWTGGKFCRGTPYNSYLKATEPKEKIAASKKELAFLKDLLKRAKDL